MFLSSARISRPTCARRLASALASVVDRPCLRCSALKSRPPLRRLGPCRLATVHTAARLARDRRILAGRTGPCLGATRLSGPIRAELPHLRCLFKTYAHVFTSIAKQGPRTTHPHPRPLHPIQRSKVRGSRTSITGKDSAGLADLCLLRTGTRSTA
jgi:hypothetical protein